MSLEKKKKSINDISTWNSGVNLSNTDRIINFLRYGSMATTESSAQTVMTRRSVLKNLTVQLGSASGNLNISPGNNASRTFTIRKNGQDTPLKVTISGSDTNGSNNDDEVVVNEFDLISLSHTVEGVPENYCLGIISVERL